MNIYVWLIFNSILLGFGLAMDAFSVSLANGFSECNMKRNRMIYISGIYAIFQFIMPVIGWFLVHFAVSFFQGFHKYIPYVSLLLLSFIGIKMILEGIKAKKCINNGDCDNCNCHGCEIKDDVHGGTLTTRMLILQGIATSIDALSVGFTIADYSAPMVLLSALIIGIVTHIICFIGLKLGTKFGTKFSGNAQIIGGIILVAIGIEICIKGII